KHHIDFQDAMRIFEGPIFEKATRSHGEDRVLAIGLIEGIEIVVVYVTRGKRRRIISARRAHRHERQDYADHLTLPLQRLH
ncbi:MAG TPA: BrnT family toxin, partial [Candidatus Elarobacter sp.]|nr:BrnT family toxin [Candidatus Elarobacter sp.]